MNLPSLKGLIVARRLRDYCGLKGGIIRYDNINQKDVPIISSGLHRVISGLMIAEQASLSYETRHTFEILKQCGVNRTGFCRKYGIPTDRVKNLERWNTEQARIELNVAIIKLINDVYGAIGEE